MNTSANGIALIKSFYRFQPTPFKHLGDGSWSIGYGHVFPRTDNLPQVITEAQGENYLTTDIVAVDATLTALLTQTVSQTQWDALSSLYYSLGAAFNNRKTTPIDYVNQGKTAQVPSAIRDMRGHGLKKRYLREANLFETGSYTLPA